MWFGKLSKLREQNRHGRAASTLDAISGLQNHSAKCDNGEGMIPVGSISSSHTALIAGVAAAFFVISWTVLAIVTPIVVASLPEDYFANPDYLEIEGVFSANIPFPRRAMLVLKNILAWFLIIIGPFLFQSIFAPFFGLLLADFRAKPRMIRKFASLPFVWRMLNAIRRHRHLPPFCEPRTKNQETRTEN